MNSGQSYKDRVLETYGDTLEALVNCDVPRNIVDYRSAHVTPRIPTAAFSDFLINRQLGDWSESLLRTSFNQQFEDYRASKYGAGGDLIAGEQGFRQMYIDYHAEIRTIGKRPDLLIFDRETFDRLQLRDDISTDDSVQLSRIAKAATRAMEVRSSRYLAAKYRRVKGEEQSFTPKLEDLPILTRWIVVHDVPCFYTQIFLDEIHMISFLKILQIIRDTGDEYLDKAARNQRKSTFYIPVSEGALVGQIVGDPTWEGKVRPMNDGRMIIYVTPRGGRMSLSNELIQHLEL